MKVGVLLGGLIGAILGAIAWAVITAVTGYEVGYVAWGIGLLVGFGAKLAGGYGKTAGVTCAVLALVSIFAGKMLAVQYVFEKELREVVEQEVTRVLYDEVVADAADFSGVASEHEYPAFMVAHGYTEADDPERVPAEDLAGFTNTWVGTLREFQTDPPSYEEWREKHVETAVDSALAQSSIAEFVIEDLGLLDAVFALLGLATAYKIACGTREDETALEA